jgi:fructosamine-3-kinase
MTFREQFSEMAADIGKASGAALLPQPTSRVHGGSINECYRWDGTRGSIFVKVAANANRAAFEAEAAGLEALGQTRSIRVPAILSVGASAAYSWIALEWLRFGAQSHATEFALGERLARMHRATADDFGWHRDNTIGSTPQSNGRMNDWVAFFRDRRLRYQFDLAARNGYGGRLQRRGLTLLDGLAPLFTWYRPRPSLLHGDLWGGNWGTDEFGEPVIFDPAVYYGDREVDVAMTRLFGGFGAQFYAGYQTTWPLDPGAPVRTELYNLYHVLNHVNLFGDAYLAQAERMVDKLLAQLGH